MIRPVLYVDLPGIIYAIDRRARSKQHEFANFVCWLEQVESNLPPSPILRNILPLNPLLVPGYVKIAGVCLALPRCCERPAHTAWEYPIWPLWSIAASLAMKSWLVP